MLVTPTARPHPQHSAAAAAGPSRDTYAALALPYIPRLLHLIDRNPFSRTYGCFDRAYWHYRTMDFPCGMSQEFVLPLAMVYAREFPGNRYKGVERIRELAEGAVRYMVPSSYRDGTTDDYFPFERAMGALVFSLYAASESYQILGMKDERVVDLFSRRVAHLAHENETGQLANHQALAALAAYNVYKITGDPRHKKVADDRVELTLSWQHKDEGWFQEYEGADPGYHTCTIDFLAKLMQKRGDQSLVAPLKKAVEFAWHFMHPDGSYGGEYGSRNTYHFYPHGFELMAPHSDKAGQIADNFLAGALRGKRYINDDDRMTAHYVYDFLQSWQDYCPTRPRPIAQDRAQARLTWMPGCKMAVCWTGEQGSASGYHAAANLSKGGVIKVFDQEGPVASDTGLIGELDDGRVVVSHLVIADQKVEADTAKRRFSVRAPLCRRKHKLPTPFQNVIFRMLMLTVGRFNANLVRSTLQKILITGKPTTGFEVSRTIEFLDDRVVVEDRVPVGVPLRRLAVGSDATSIYVANSNVYQESVLCPWQHADVEKLPVEDGQRIWRREYFRGSGHGPAQS
jgi:hypothetical protein